VTAVLDVWDSWSLYPQHSLLACRTAFSGKDAADTLDGEELDMSMFEGAGEESPAQEDGNAAPDGAKRQKLEDIDGEPMADDIDGEPMTDFPDLASYADAEEAD
jgi:hypothetical protein